MGTPTWMQRSWELMIRSKVHRTPHVMIPLPLDRFQEDLRYDVQVEMELVRPERGQEEMGKSGNTSFSLR